MINKKEFLRLFWPVLIEQILATTIGMVNTMMVSGVGETAISAVSIVDSLNFVIMNLFIAFATGATVVVAQRVGAKDFSGANETASQSMTACVGTAVISGALFIIFGPQIVNLLFAEAEPAVKAYTGIYLNYSSVSYPFLAIFSMAAGILRASGNTRSPMRASIISNIVNAVVGALCIYVLEWGVMGAGIALLFSRIVSAVLLLKILIRNDNGVRLKKIALKLNRSVLMPVIQIGLPACIDGLIFNGGKLLVQTYVTALGTISLAANGIAASINNFVNIPGNAMSVVAVTIIGQAVGTGIFGKELRKIMRTLVGYAMVLLTAMSLLMAPLLPIFVDLYKPADDVRAIANAIMYMVLVLLPLTWPVAFILPSCIRSTGDAVFVTIGSILSMWFVRVLGAWFAVYQTSWGLFGIWVFWCMDWVVRGIIFIARTYASPYISGKQRMRAFKTFDNEEEAC